MKESEEVSQRTYIHSACMNTGNIAVSARVEGAGAGQKWANKSME